MATTTWTPIPLELHEGNPFTYPESDMSAAEVFNTGVNQRDAEACIVCGFDVNQCLEKSYIVPKDEERNVRLPCFCPFLHELTC